MSESISRKGAWPISTWLSVISLMFGSFALISSELLPMAVLTPMAADLGVTEGVAGQAVTLAARTGNECYQPFEHVRPP